MPFLNLLADVVFEVEHVPAGGRNARKDMALEAIPLSVAEVGAADAPVVMEVAFTDATHSFVIKGQPLPIRLFEGRLVSRPHGSDGDPRPLGSLSTIEGGPRVSWRDHDPYPFLMPGATLHNERLNKSPPRFEDLRIRRLIASSRERAVAHATAMAARICVIDGEPWVPVGGIGWAGRRYNVNMVQPETDLATREPCARFAPWHADEAIEYATWMERGLVREGARELNVVTGGSVEVLRRDLVPDPYLPLALASLGNLPDKGWGAGDMFAMLPLPVLEGWIRFRSSVDAMRAGDATRVPDAFSALEEMRSALPRNASEDIVRRSGYRNIERVSTEMTRYHDTYLSGLAPDPSLDDADAVELGMLRPVC